MDIRLILSVLCLLVLQPADSQPDIPGKGYVFNDSIVPRIDILIDDVDLGTIFAHPASDDEFPATFIFSTPSGSDTLRDIGFRLRGNTSRYSAKKSYKVSFNTFTPGRKFYGLEKMNINGEHNDPSILRAKLCWDMMQFLKVPASRANHVRLYINQVYYGLYLNVEHVDEEFIRSRFGDIHGNLYKCLYPADLNYLGDKQESYKLETDGRRAYDLKTNIEYDDYQDLADLIRTINITGQNVFACELEKVFNIPGFLKIIAIDILTGNWDDYTYLKNNFYLYSNPTTGKFEFIPYDMDNTFGVDWFNIDWAGRNIYQWSSGESRPLYERLMAIPEFRNLFSYYMEDILNTYFNLAQLSGRIDRLHDLIRPYVVNDPYYPLDYGFQVNDFDNAPGLAFGVHVKYGLKSFIQQRVATAGDQLVVNGIKPVVTHFQWNQPGIHDTLMIRALVGDNDLLNVRLMLARNDEDYEELAMFDDGLHGDNDMDDGVYGIKVTGTGSPWKAEFYLKVTDQAGNIRDYPCEPVTVTVPVTPGSLVINEIMAGNISAIHDEYSEYDDWIEIYNPNPYPVWLGDKFLSDDLSNRDKWEMPGTSLSPNDFLVIWADGQVSQGDFHADFRLDKSGEEVVLSDAPSTGFRVIDKAVFSRQADNISFARSTDGGTEWQLSALPTPGRSNHLTAIIGKEEPADLMIVYPNPVRGETVFFNRTADFSLTDVYGRVLMHGADQDMFYAGFLSPGIYILLFDNRQAVRLIKEE